MRFTLAPPVDGGSLAGRVVSTGFSIISTVFSSDGGGGGGGGFWRFAATTGGGGLANGLPASLLSSANGLWASSSSSLAKGFLSAADAIIRAAWKAGSRAWSLSDRYQGCWITCFWKVKIFVSSTGRYIVPIWIRTKAFSQRYNTNFEKKKCEKQFIL